MYKILLTLFLMTMGSITFAQSSDAESTEEPACPTGYICTKGETSGTQTIDSRTTVKSPPASAISPTINSTNSDSCTVGVSGAVQTQILGISAGKTVRDFNCERLKNAKTLYDMGMKVAAVSVMCQDERIFDAMMDAGSPCPYDGMIGDMAKEAWKADPKGKEENNGRDLRIFKDWEKEDADTAKGAMGVGALLLLLLL
jgi:hypothetical protein|tara:strand:- start:931 stop:1527 length:597 start_codon:yes stop_codon:yes gene_type:complete